MIKALLCDLDGTLLHMDTDHFVEQYIRHLSPRIAHLVPPDRFARQLLSSTSAMVKNSDPDVTNQEAFVADFFPKIGFPVEILMPIFDDFYENHFRHLRQFTRMVPEARAVLEAAAEKGLRLAIATNPVFPMSAIRQRIEWAGIGDFEFQVVTAYENMHFCKPLPQYYQEVVHLVGCRPEECLMVGNDVDEDLVAATLGIRTFLVEDCLINRRGGPPVADRIGKLADVAAFIGDGEIERL